MTGVIQRSQVTGCKIPAMRHHNTADTSFRCVHLAAKQKKQESCSAAVSCSRTKGQLLFTQLNMQTQHRWNLQPQPMRVSFQGNWIHLKRNLCHVSQQPSNDRLVRYTRSYPAPRTKTTTFKTKKHNLMAFLWHLSLKNKIKTKKRSSQLCSKCSCQLRKADLQKFTEK